VVTETAETDLLLNVVQRIWRVNSEADKDDMRVRVAEGTKAVVVFLASGIPQRKFDVFPVDLYICNVVLKHGGDVNLVSGEIVKFVEGAKRRGSKPPGMFLSRRLSTSRSDKWVRRGQGKARRERIPFRKHRRPR
jgi:hypothetical protein